MKTTYHSIFETFYDAAIFGAGYAGFAAVRSLSGKGKRVLLVDRQGAALWEGGWSFYPHAGSAAHDQWKTWSAELEGRGILQNGQVDGACAEVVASEFLKNQRIATLYFAAPLWVEKDEKDLVVSVVLGTKSGLRRIRAAQFIDATEDAELARLLDPKAVPSAPAKKEIHLYFQQLSRTSPSGIHLNQAADTELSFGPSHWDNESRLSISIPGASTGIFSHWIPALEALRKERPVDVANAILTHGSVRPYPIYRASVSKPLGMLPANLALAVPGLHQNTVETLSERFALGALASESLAGKPLAKEKKSPSQFDLPAFKEKNSEIAVAGTGTGGLLAAIAAGKCGAEVAALELLPYAGGIGAGGGIHWYYFGVSGGLQEELDERTRNLMPLFGKKKNQIMGFHPDAKKAAAEAMLREAGVAFHPGSIVVSVEASKGRVERALVSSPTGPFWLSAKAWIDATGDGDLSASAGAAFHFGRQGDGLLHHFSQSSGATHTRGEDLRMDVVNYDAGFVDPTDPEDLTRARLLGISQYAQRRYSAKERPTYIAPALGLRQSRHIVCDTMLSLDDLIVNRRFPDAVGMTGCHYDNHAVDYELESDEGLFWVWGCRNWRKRTGSDIPYGMLLPKGLENVWVACRAFGVTEEAHHSMRMQRDIQRVGEVAGYAAVLSLKAEGRSRAVLYAELEKLLLKTGALKPRTEETREDFGPAQEIAFLQTSPEKRTEALFKELDASEDSTCLWYLYRNRETSEAGIRMRLNDSNPRTQWRAALVAAMWGLPEAEPRLLEAIRSRESGFETLDKKDRPEENIRVAPNWITAVGLLRRSGTKACLSELKALAVSKEALFNIKTSIALTLERLAQRLKTDVESKKEVEVILGRLVESASDCVADLPGRNILYNQYHARKDLPSSRPPAAEDFTWQLSLVVTKALLAWEIPSAFKHASAFEVDERAYVRKAFEKLQTRSPQKTAGRPEAVSPV